MNSFKVNCLIVASLAMSSVSYADSSPNTLTGGIDVVRGAAQQLEDELGRRGNQNQFNASDYKKWNESFRVHLNQVLDRYEQRLEAEVAVKLEPLSKRYNSILAQTTLREDQVKALKQATLLQLQAIADGLAAQNAVIYQQAFVEIFSFFPAVPQYTFEKINTRRHVFGDPSTQCRFKFDVSTLGKASTPNVTEEVGMGGSDDGKIYDWDNDSKSSTIPTVAPFQGAPISSNFCYGKSMELSDDAAWTVANSFLSVKEKDGIFGHFIEPILNDGCQSQVCLALKAADILMTLQSMKTQIDQPFKITFSDTQSVEVKPSSLDITAYEKLLSVTYVDSSLPFDTN